MRLPWQGGNAKAKPFTVIPGDEAGRQDQAAAGHAPRKRPKRLQQNKYAQGTVSEAKNAHPDGPYLHATETGGKYQNVATCVHMLNRLVRLSSSGVHTVDWQLSLRGNDHTKPNGRWRRHFSKPAQTFDALRESRKDEVYREQYEKLPGTPDYCRADRFATPLIRDDQPNFKRAKGCEGTHAGQWLHLLQDRQRGTKNRSQLHHETSLREKPGDPHGARISDNRCEGCIVEMLGKKNWSGTINADPSTLAVRPPEGDVRLHHLRYLKVEPEPDEDNWKLRVGKTPRRDADECGET